MSLRHWKAQSSGSSGLQRCGIHVLSKYCQHLPQSAVGVADADEDVEVADDRTVVLLAKIEEEESQSSGMLLPSSSSRESGARVQAGPGVSLLKELLWVNEVVVVSKSFST
jgi:hypothetical protein